MCQDGRAGVRYAAPLAVGRRISKPVQPAEGVRSGARLPMEQIGHESHEGLGWNQRASDPASARNLGRSS